MNKLILMLATIALAGSLLTGCANVSRQDVGIAGGAVAGGLVGSAVSGGSTAATIGGAVGGAFLGREVAKRTE